MLDDFKDLQNDCLELLHDFVAVPAIIETLDGKKFTVPVTMDKEKINTFTGTIYIDKIQILFNILKSDLIASGNALRGYKKITHRGQVYNVLSVSENVFGARIQLICEILNGDKNNG